MQKTQNSQNYFEKNKVEDLFMYRMTQYCLDINYPPKLLYRFIAIPDKTPVSSCVDIYSLILKSI